MINIILAAIFIVTSGALFQSRFRGNRYLTILASLVAVVSAFYLLRSIYNDVTYVEKPSVTQENESAVEFGSLLGQVMLTSHIESGTFDKNQLRENFPSFEWSDWSTKDELYSSYYASTGVRIGGFIDTDLRTGAIYKWTVQTTRNHPSWGPYIVEFTRDEMGRAGSGYLHPDRATKIIDGIYDSIIASGIKIRLIEECGYENVFVLTFNGIESLLVIGNSGGNSGVLINVGLASQKFVQVIESGTSVISTDLLKLFRKFLFDTGVRYCIAKNGEKIR